MATCTGTSRMTRHARSKPDKQNYVIPAKRKQRHVSFKEPLETISIIVEHEDRSVTVTRPDTLRRPSEERTVTITRPDTLHRPSEERTVTITRPDTLHRPSEERTVTITRPDTLHRPSKERTATITRPDTLRRPFKDRTVTNSRPDKLRHPSEDSGIGSLSLDSSVENSVVSRFTSDVAQYPDSLRTLLTKAYTDISSLTEKEKRSILRMLLVQVWKNEGFEEKAAYTCSCLVQREVDSEQDDSFCRVVETSCSGLILDSATLKDQFHQWEKFITFLHHLSCHMKSVELHNRLQCLVSHALNVTLALL